MGGTMAGGASEKTVLGENAAERYTAEDNAMHRADSSIRTKTESTEINKENPNAGKVQSVTGTQAGGETIGVMREGTTEEGMAREEVTEGAELHQADALNAPEETGTATKGGREPQPPQMASMSEDKWQQLWKIYPHIRPFQDERQYLSLRPEDFVILHSGAYRLVQNSFLLHGYFNYNHLILTQVSQRNGNQYYIGVPGNFYEKEKQVAIMYGFGSFECRQEPAQEGDFGYYMIKVEL